MGEIKDFIEIYIEDLELLEESTAELADTLETNIKKEAPYDEGRLKRSIRVDSRIYKKYSIIKGYWDEGLAPHGIFVLAGTKAHDIYPKGIGLYHAGKQLTKGAALRTPYGLFKHVRHPGTKANDFLGRGLSRTLEAYQ